MSNTNYTTGKIAAILDKHSVVINKGQIDGVSSGDMFYIFTEIGPFFDPDTNENLGTTKKIWGKVRVSILEKRFSIAETEYSLNFSLPQALLGARVQLPVDESEIVRDASKISVGTSVILGIHPKQIESQERPVLPDPEFDVNSMDNADEIEE